MSINLPSSDLLGSLEDCAGIRQEVLSTLVKAGFQITFTMVKLFLVRVSGSEKRRGIFVQTINRALLR